MSKPLVLAVVGHTNVGKTSLLRTLLRDPEFGEVSPRPSTTRRVEGARLSVDGEPLIELYDTPGLEAAIGLLEYLERLPKPGERPDPPELLARFLATGEARLRFEQEVRVLRQLLLSDAGLYVIDAREPVLAKYRDELAVLAMCGKPLLPVLNFVASEGHRAEEWRTALARIGLHALVRFDTVAPPVDGERRLYESLTLLMEEASPRLQRLIADLEAKARARRRAAAQLIAGLLIDVAACRRSVPAQPELERQAAQELREAVRARDQRCVDDLLRLYAFRPGDAEYDELPLLDGRWEHDLFNPETLRQLGIKVGGGMAAGAAAGATIDLLLGGASLGGAALLGALAGGTAQTARNYGQRLLGRFRGQRELTVEDPVLRLLALRQLQLVRALEARGHAASERLRLALPERSGWQGGELPGAVLRARAHPEWSALNPGARLDLAERQLWQQRLAELLLAEIDPAAADSR
ncbi:MAG: GTPase/DUF3482 domain-containing protein [Xanthomonadaceae bacterium]|nr:GTPase/DUF3482 domain-containing protein [Xanthomonadaceae bacterium]